MLEENHKDALSKYYSDENKNFNFYIDLGKWIKKERKKRDMSQKELADELKISNSVLSRCENGEIQISAETLFKLSLVLNVNIYDFFFEYYTDNFVDLKNLLKEHKYLNSEYPNELDEEIDFIRILEEFKDEYSKKLVELEQKIMNKTKKEDE